MTTDQTGRGEVIPLSAPHPATQTDAPTITRTLVTGHFLDGKVWREYAYTVTIGDREFIRRFEQAGKK